MRSAQQEERMGRLGPSCEVSIESDLALRAAPPSPSTLAQALGTAEKFSVNPNLLQEGTYE
jgi:hypothetical protein